MNQAEQKKKRIIKVILIGNSRYNYLSHSSVGKTSLLQRFVSKKFSPQLKTTVGADFHTRNVEVGDKSAAVQVSFYLTSDMGYCWTRTLSKFMLQLLQRL